jgi:preprotein translocase subunit YajC
VFTSAFAQVPGAASGGMDLVLQMAPFAVILVIMYFLIMRPQQKRAKDHRDLIANVRRGDTVVTTGGLVGRVTKATEPAEIELEIAQNVRVRVMRQMISEVRAKGEPVKDIPAKV